MTCPKCERPTDADGRFCKHCGAYLNSTPGPQPVHGRPHRLAEIAAAGAERGSDADSETLIWFGRPSWRSFYGTWALTIVLCIAAIFAVYRVTEPPSSLRTWIWGLVAAAVVVLAVRETLLIFGQRYRLTSLRLFVDRGILSRLTDQTELVRVDDVRIRQGLVDRIVDTGDVEILGSDATDELIVLESIHEPAEVAEQILKHTRAIRSKHALFVEHV